MKCVNCGIELSENETLCHACGTMNEKCDEHSEEETSSDDNDGERILENEIIVEESEKPIYSIMPKKNYKPLIMALIILSVAVISFLIGYLKSETPKVERFKITFKN